MHVIGTGAGQPLVILHGLLGAARNWGLIAKDLGRDWHVSALDLPNHGASDWSDQMDYPFLADRVGDWIARHCANGAVVMGHSMGGKAAMTLALGRADLVRSLIVVDIAPVSYAHHEFRDYAAAMRAVPLGTVSSRADVDLHLARTVKDARVRAFLMTNLETGEGGYRWRANLDVLERNLPDILGFPEPPEGAVYPGPCLFVVGGASDYVEAKDHARIKALFPQAQIVTTPEAGHWVHADHPQQFLAAVRAFLAAG